VPIVALTASVLPEDIEACLASGMNHVIAKPISLKVLEQVLVRWSSAASRAA
jgi:CheY-like chemotaxis protein